MTRFLAPLCALTVAAMLAAAPAIFAAAPAVADEAAPGASKATGKPAGESAAPTPASAGIEIVNIGYIGREVDRLPPRNLTQANPKDEGLLGAKLGIDDDNTTGKFTKQEFRLTAVTVPATGDIAEAFKKLAAEGNRHIIVNAAAADVLALADLPEAKETMIYNAGAPDDRLRNADCRANVFHTLANRAMLTDALAQYLIKKKWTRWFLVVGQDEADKLYADGIRRAAKKFGAKVVAEKPWTYNTEEERRTSQSEIPVFTQGPDYQVLVVADEADNFGDDFMYRSWDPRPVAGTQGLIAADWHPAFEQWGATQLEDRFQKLASRTMTSKDFAAWTAARVVGEAATRTKSTDFKMLRDFILGPDFTVGVFKGVGANFRDWDHQLRTPIVLAAPNTVVAVSPQQEFIHPVSNLDTLGFDKPESSCKFK